MKEERLKYLEKQKKLDIIAIAIHSVLLAVELALFVISLIQADLLMALLLCPITSALLIAYIFMYGRELKKTNEEINVIVEELIKEHEKVIIELIKEIRRKAIENLAKVIKEQEEAKPKPKERKKKK